MKEKKILFVTNRLGGGGAERVLNLLANKFRKIGHEVNIVYFIDSNNDYSNNCCTIKLKYSNKIDQIIQLRKAIVNINPDVVIAFEYFINMKTILATIGLDVKVIISERNDPNKLNSKPLLKILRNILYACSDALVCQTEDAKEFFSKRIQKKSVVILNPIKEGLPQWDRMNYKNKIINFCRLEKQKNIPLLIDCFEKIIEKYPHYELLIYGEGSEKSFLKSYIEKRDLEKHIKIESFNSDIHEIASKCHMFVSSSDYEGLSNSMIEAMAMGMPVICTDCAIGGARMVIESNVNGILVPVNNRDELTSALIKVIEEPQLANYLGENAGKIREELSLNNICYQWEKILNELLDNV